MICLIIISWYLIGVFGLIWIGRKIDRKTTRKDVLVGLTLGGMFGLLTWVIGLSYLMKTDWFDKDVF